MSDQYPPGQGYGDQPPEGQGYGGQPPTGQEQGGPSYGQQYPGAPQYPATPQYPQSYGTPPPPPGAPSGMSYPGSAWDGDSGGPSGWSGLAIAAFVVGLVVPLLGLLIAVPLGIVALVKISGTRLRGRVLAILGIVFAVLWWVLVVVIYVVFGAEAERDGAGSIVDAGRIAYGDLREGDCVSLPDPGSGEIDSFDLEGVPCTDAHNLEVASVIAIDGEGYPGEAELQEQSVAQCQADVQDLLGSQAGYQPYPLYPDESLWDDDQGHRVVCFVATSGFDDMTAPLAE